jgi:uncharacterized membrane protein
LTSGRTPPWTFEDDVALAALTQAGLKSGAIAARLGRSRNAVNHRLSKMHRRVTMFGGEPTNLSTQERAELTAE